MEKYTMIPNNSASPADQPSPLRRWLVPLLFLVVVGVPWALLFRTTTPTTVVFAPSIDVAVSNSPASKPVDSSTGAATDLLQQQQQQQQQKEEEEDESRMSEEERLERVLGAAATEDRTVVLTLLNAAWAEEGSVLELFMESFRIGNGTAWLLNHLVIVSVDEKAHRRCREVHPHCFALVTEGVDFSGYKEFMSADYLRMMWRRLDFLRIVLERGFNFIFSDVDIMWFRDPFARFIPDGDFQIACDKYVGDPTSLANSPNNGFNYVRSNNRTVAFYRFWYDSQRRFPGQHEQNVLNLIKHDPYLARIGVRLRFLSTEFFGGICEMSRDFNKVCTFHVNCCIGLRRKIYDLKLMLDDWRRYMGLPPPLQSSLPHKWSIPDHCRLGFVEHGGGNEVRHRL